MPSAELSRRVEKVVGYPPLSELGDLQRREFHEALLDADSFEDLAVIPKHPATHDHLLGVTVAVRAPGVVHRMPAVDPLDGVRHRPVAGRDARGERPGCDRGT